MTPIPVDQAVAQGLPCDATRRPAGGDRLA